MIDFIKKSNTDTTCNEIINALKKQHKNKVVNDEDLKKVLKLILNTERLKSLLPYL